jgi:hypothetical protein
VAVWLTGVPLGIAVMTVAVGRVIGVHEAGRLITLVVAYLVWALVGGTVVRPFGRWWEVVFVAGALVGLLLALDLGAYIAADVSGQLKPGDDNAIGVGMVLLVVVAYPPTVASVAFGRLIRRAVAVIQSGRDSA